MPKSTVRAEPFTGFTSEGFAFLHALGQMQDRQWFQEYRETYDSGLRAPMMALVAAVTTRLAGLGLPFRCDPARAVFRIHRDTRFSHDKRPYKTNIGAAITRNGEKMNPGVLYIHIDPDGSFLAAGFYRPEPEILNSLRRHILADPSRYRQMTAALASHTIALSSDPTALKRTPRDFANAEADLLPEMRRRSFTVERVITLDEALSPNLLDTVTTFATHVTPLLQFGWDAIDAYRSLAVD